MPKEYYQELREEISFMGSDQERITVFIEFACLFECSRIEPRIRGPCGLHYDFYLNEGGFTLNAPFLFGTPSQYRKI
jgi:hypothetical protein